MSSGITAAMRRPGFAILESLSAIAMEGCQETLLADSAMHIRDNRIPGTRSESSIVHAARAQEVVGQC